jgi:FAD/FMN-containing dehydrogenase
VSAQDWGALGRAVAGEVVLAGAPGYDEARATAIANFAHVRPQAVVRCATAQDVAEALAFARRRRLDVAPRSGGHCFAGRSSTGGIVIDVTPMASVSVTGVVATIGAGARLEAVYDALHEHGLTIPAGCGAGVGIAGLTLGGGFGVLGRVHGLTCDRLRGAQVVLADGRIVDCHEDHHGDLFWALRGAGGGRFGIVTTLIFDAVSAPAATSFRVGWPLADAAAVVAAWQDWAPTAPDELHAALQLTSDGVTLFGTMLAGGGQTIAAIEQLAERARADPTAATHAHLPYRDAKRWLGDEDDEARRRVGRSEFFRRSLPRAAVDALVSNLAGQHGAEVNLTPWGGAYNRVPEAATAFAHRHERFLVEHVTSTATAWVNRSWACVHPWGSGRVYPNFPEPGLPEWSDAYHAGNRERLLAVKRAYDPEDVFGRRRSR